MSIRHKIRKKNLAAGMSIVFCFWLRMLKNNTKLCIKMVRTSNKSTFVLKNKFHLSIHSYLKSRAPQCSKGNIKFLEAKGQTTQE